MAQFGEQFEGVLAIDGKVLRRSFDRASSKSAPHMVSPLGQEQRLVLAQIATDAKPNEITVVRTLPVLKGTLFGDVILPLDDPEFIRAGWNDGSLYRLLELF